MSIKYEYKGDLADVVITKNALHILPDFWKMTAFLKIAAMLKPSGKFYLRDVIFSFSPAESESAINQWIGAVATPKGEGWTQADFEIHVREEYSTFTWIIEAMLMRSGFDITAANYPSPTYAEYLCSRAS